MLDAYIHGTCRQKTVLLREIYVEIQVFNALLVAHGYLSWPHVGAPSKLQLVEYGAGHQPHGLRVRFSLKPLMSRDGSKA